MSILSNYKDDQGSSVHHDSMLMNSKKASLERVPKVAAVPVKKDKQFYQLKGKRCKLNDGEDKQRLAQEYSQRQQRLDTKLCRHGLLKPKADDGQDGRANRSCQGSSQFKPSFDETQNELSLKNLPSENTNKVGNFIRSLHSTDGGMDSIRKPTIIPSQLTIGSTDQVRPVYTAQTNAF